MKQEEKINSYKDIIIKLYSIEGRNKSYIARLLNVNRSKLTQMINNWNIEKAQKYHMKPSTEKFLNKNKQFILSKINEGYLNTAIAKTLQVPISLITTVVKNDIDLNTAFENKKLLDKHNAASRKKDLMNKSRLNYSFKKLSNEIWKPILGYPNYQISNFGRVKAYSKSYKKWYLKILETNCLSNRIYVSLYNESGKKKLLQVSRLVGHAFISGHSAVNNTINHKDGDIQNNYYLNLEWVSQSKNNKHAYEVLNRSKVSVNSHKRYKYIYLYKDNKKYEFKTLASLARFLKKSETQTRRYLDNSPEGLKIVYELYN